MKREKLNKEIIKKFIEKGADLEHQRWARWQAYLFSKCKAHFEYDKSVSKVRNTGGLVIPKKLVERWQRQIDTPYEKLSEQEKESDKKEVRKYLPLLEKALFRQREEIKQDIQSVINMLEGSTVTREQIVNYIKKYLLTK